MARPNILMFGDADWVPSRSQRQLNALREWQARQWDLVVVELGAGLAIPTVRWHAESTSIDTGALVRINPREPEIPGGKGVSLGVGALEALRAIDARL